MTACVRIAAQCILCIQCIHSAVLAIRSVSIPRPPALRFAHVICI